MTSLHVFASRMHQGWFTVVAGPAGDPRAALEAAAEFEFLWSTFVVIDLRRSLVACADEVFHGASAWAWFCIAGPLAMIQRRAGSGIRRGLANLIGTIMALLPVSAMARVGIGAATPGQTEGQQEN